MPEKLKELLLEALAYECQQFDGPPDVDLDVSGADLVEWFANWRLRVREALKAVPPPDGGER